jgi:hypothetical protein
VLLSSGKLFTFGESQYNQIISLKNSEKPCLMSEHIQKEYGKIIKAITSANSLMLITSKKKILIFGKFNSDNTDEVLVIDLLKYEDNYEFAFTDNILEFISLDENDQNIFGNMKYEKIETFVEKAYDENQIAKKNITRNTLSNMSTLKAKEESFCKDDDTIELEQEINKIKVKANNSGNLERGKGIGDKQKKILVIILMN